ILEANAIEHVLPGRQTFEQCLGGEIGLPRRDAETQARLALMCRIENARHGGTSARALRHPPSSSDGPRTRHPTCFPGAVFLAPKRFEPQLRIRVRLGSNRSWLWGRVPCQMPCETQGDRWQLVRRADAPWQAVTG